MAKCKRYGPSGSLERTERLALCGRDFWNPKASDKPLACESIQCLSRMNMDLLKSQRYEYEATWVAANFKITPPTPETHPKFPLWELGYTPEEVYEKFWPAGFQYVKSNGFFISQALTFAVFATILKGRLSAVGSVPRRQNSGGTTCFILRRGFG
jgi:hypothetical protein